MNIVLLVRDQIETAKKAASIPVPDGFCPKCWGLSEYGDSFYKTVLEKKSETKGQPADLDWIRAYVLDNLLPIKLFKNKDLLLCINCNSSYNPEDLVD